MFTKMNDKNIITNKLNASNSKKIKEGIYYI